MPIPRTLFELEPNNLSAVELEQQLVRIIADSAGMNVPEGLIRPLQAALSSYQRGDIDGATFRAKVVEATN